MMNEKLERAKNILISIHDMKPFLVDGETYESQNESLKTGIKALDQISHLIDRPCSACEYHKENGCCKWSCVFEK